MFKNRSLLLKFKSGGYGAYDVVVGAGPSGLIASYEAARGASVVVLEEDAIVGGAFTLCWSR